VPAGFVGSVPSQGEHQVAMVYDIAADLPICLMANLCLNAHVRTVLGKVSFSQPYWSWAVSL